MNTQALQEPITISHADWLGEAKRRYHERARHLRFVCPSCCWIQTGQDFLDLGLAPEKAVTVLGFSCIGRWIPASDPRRVTEAFVGPPGPCNYTSGGLIRIAPVIVQLEKCEIHVFDFADEPLTLAGQRQLAKSANR